MPTSTAPPSSGWKSNSPPTSSRICLAETFRCQQKTRFEICNNNHIFFSVFSKIFHSGQPWSKCKHKQAHTADSNRSASPKITESAWYFSSLQGYGYWLSTCLFDDRFWNLLGLARLVFHPAGISPMGIIVLFCFWWDFQPLGSCCLGCQTSDFFLIIFVQPPSNSIKAMYNISSGQAWQKKLSRAGLFLDIGKDQHQHFSWFPILHILLLFQATPIFSRNVPTNLTLVLCLMLPSDFQPSGIITFSCSTYDHPFGTWASSTHPSLFVLMTIDFSAGAVHTTSVLNWTTVSNSSCSLEISSALFLALSISISMLFASPDFWEAIILHPFAFIWVWLSVWCSFVDC